MGLVWRILGASLFSATTVSLASVVSGVDATVTELAAVGAAYISFETLHTMLKAPPRKAPQNVIDELRATARDVFAHRDGNGLWIVRNPAEPGPKIFTESEFLYYERLIASQGRALDKLKVNGQELTLCRYVAGKLHAPGREPAVVIVDLVTGKGSAAFFQNGRKTSKVAFENMEIPSCFMAARPATGADGP